MSGWRQRLHLRLATVAFVLLFIAAVGLLLWLARDYHWRFDWTANGRNSLSAGSVALVQRLDKPVKITAFASSRENQRKAIGDLVARYQRHNPRISLDFIDPDKEPLRTQEAGIQIDGAMIIQYSDSKETVDQPSEQNLTNALARVARGGERWVVFLSGHGERRPDMQANHDLSSWTAQLRARGVKTRALSLADHPQLPQNTAVLVIAAPQVKLLAGEVKRIEEYVARGGNLLWLTEPGTLQGLEPLAELFDLEFPAGVIVDPESQLVTGNDPRFVVVARYGNHPAVQDMPLMTLFPTATAVRTNAATGWRNEVLIDTGPSAWAETGTVGADMRFDKGDDVRGPLNIGVALTRELEKREQRVVVLGDADFLSNTFLGNGGNLDLGNNLINWLTADDSFISVPARMAPDLNLVLSRSMQAAIALAFLVVLPLVFLGGGALIWWRRRRW